MSAVAACDKCGLPLFNPPIRQLQPCDGAVNRLVEIDQLRPLFDENACAPELVDQRALVLVLRKDEDLRIRSDTSADVAK